MGTDRNLDQFHAGVKALNLSLTEAQNRQFLLYYEMLVEWNQKMNLTAITEFDDVVTKHFLDSLSLVKAVPLPAGQRVVDVGTGAGFPGIPLKIVFPELDMVLVDSVGKKLDFVNALIRELKISGAVCVHGRAEDLAREEAYRQRFDLCVSRAVSRLAVLAEYCLPFVKVGGIFAAYKSSDAKDEIAQAAQAVLKLGGGTAEIVSYELPGVESERSLVLVKKKEGTPQAYPRKAGTPAKAPL